MSVDHEFMNGVRAAFGPELASGTLHVVGHSYSQEAFGNAEAILACSEFRLKLARSRSEQFAELAHPKFPEEWNWLQLVIRAFRGEEEVEHNYEIDFEMAANLLRANRELLAQGFTKGWGRTTRARLRRLKEEHTRRVTEWLQSAEGKRWKAETDAAIEQELATPSPELLEVLRQLNLKP